MLLSMQVDRKRVAERVRQQVERLPVLTDTVRSPEEQGVIEVAVDALGVVASRVQPLEV